MIDRTLLAHEQREKYLAKRRTLDANCLVWVLGKEGKVFGSCIPYLSLGINGIKTGVHEGLLWWPQEF